MVRRHPGVEGSMKSLRAQCTGTGGGAKMRPCSANRQLSTCYLQLTPRLHICLRLPHLGLLLALVFRAGLVPAQADDSQGVLFDPLVPPASPAETNDVANTARGTRGPGAERGVYKARISPHWSSDNARFWYRNDLPGAAKEFVLVDARQGVRRPAFDPQSVASQIDATDTNHLPIEELRFSDDPNTLLLIAKTNSWALNLNDGTLKPSAAETPRDDAHSDEPKTRRSNRYGAEVKSPDGKWLALIKNYNVLLRACDDEKSEAQLTQDGQESNAYGLLEWAPDSKSLVAWRIEPGERKEVYLIRSSPAGGGRALLESRPYALPGDKFSRYEPSIFHVPGQEHLQPQV